MRMKAWGWWCILYVLLYLVTRWLWNTAEAWTAHVSQWGPIAQCLIHGVNKHIICLWTQWRWNKATHLQVYSWHTHGGLSWILDWRPRTGWLFMWRLLLQQGGWQFCPLPWAAGASWTTPRASVVSKGELKFLLKAPRYQVRKDGQAGEREGVGKTDKNRVFYFQVNHCLCDFFDSKKWAQKKQKSNYCALMLSEAPGLLWTICDS